MTEYGVYKCEFCHAEFINLDDKMKHIKQFHKKSTVKQCNLYCSFRQACLWEWEKVK